MRIVTALLLVFVPVAFNAVFFALQKQFDYPAILRRSTEEILRRFHAGGRGLRLTWALFAGIALLLTPLAVAVHQLFLPTPPPFLAVGTVSGVLAGLVQAMGLLRWPFVVAYLAALWVKLHVVAGQRETVAITFQALHRYAGTAIGETLGYLFTAIWTAAVCAAIIATGVVPTWMGWVGLLSAAAIAAGPFEHAGLRAAVPINAAGYVLWSLWLLAFGVALLF